MLVMFTRLKIAHLHKKHTKIFCHNFYNTRPILIEIDLQCLGYITHKVR